MRAFLALFILYAAMNGAAARPVVVELFTSEGCSSCPPADAYLTELAGRGDILPLAFHVTYWNGLGWRDPYSLELATARQTAYAASIGGGSYTPEAVVDGTVGVVGSDRHAVSAAIKTAHDQIVEAPTIRISSIGGHASIAIGASHADGRIILIGFDPRHATPVGRGENSGRTLVESNIVRSIRTVGIYRGSPLNLTESPGAGEDIAVLIQAKNGRIVGAGR